MFTQMIAEIAKVFSEFFSYEQTSVEHQSETHTIKTAKNTNAVQSPIIRLNVVETATPEAPSPRALSGP